MTGAGPATAQALETLWATGPVRQVTALGGGSINGAYRVQARGGTYHLRVYRSPDRTQVDREHAAIAAALAGGLPTPAPQPTHDGNSVARLHGVCTGGVWTGGVWTGGVWSGGAWTDNPHNDGAWAALFAQAPGAPILRSALCSHAAAALGAFLAQVHSCLPVEVPFAVPALRAASVEDTARRLQRIEQAPS